MFILCWCAVASGEEFKFNFTTGETYSYSYQRRATSRSTIFGATNTQEQKIEPVRFDVKCVAFQNDAFILDIKQDNCTTRRYLKRNGELKGSPSEIKTELPFFLVFPEGNWEVGAKHSHRAVLNVNNVECPAIWSMYFKEFDEKNSLATVDFTVQITLPQDSSRQKSFRFEGRLWFDVFKGCITKANWGTKYRLSLSNKEIAVVRNLWTVENDALHSLELFSGKGGSK